MAGRAFLAGLSRGIAEYSKRLMRAFLIRQIQSLIGLFEIPRHSSFSVAASYFDSRPTPKRPTPTPVRLSRAAAPAPAALILENRRLGGKDQGCNAAVKN